MTNSLVPQNDPSTGIIQAGSKVVDLNAIIAQMEAMEKNNMGGGQGGGSYSMQGKTKIEVNKNGTLIFTNPFTGKSEGHKSITIVPVDIKFQLQRWLMDGETIDGLDTEKMKGPICRSMQYTDPVNKTEINETGWFAQPAYSAYHAVNMLADLTGTAGCDGQQGMTMCKSCPMSTQGLKGNDAKCKPAGMMECVVFGVGDEGLEQPIYGVIKLSPVNIIQFGDYLQKLKEGYKVKAAQFAVTTITANKVTEKNRSYAKLSFHAVGKADEAVWTQVREAIERTEAVIAEAKAAEGGELGEAPATSSKPKALGSTPF